MTQETNGDIGPERMALHGTLGGSPDADLLLAACRPEFYTLASHLIAAQAQRDASIHLTRPPYGLIAYETEAEQPGDRIVTELHSWQAMRDAVVWTGVRGVESFLAARHSFALAGKLYRFKKMAAMFDVLEASHKKVTGYSEPGEALLVGGHITGAEVMVGAQQSIGEVVQAALPQAPAVFVARIVQNSAAVVTQPAATARGTIYHVLNAIDAVPKATGEQLELGEFTRVDPALLEYIGTGKPRVRYQKPFKDHIDPVLGKKISQLDGRFPVLGCPALRNMVIKQYWERTTDIAYRAGLWGRPEPASAI